MDWSMIRDSISPAANQMQLRQAAVISVEAGGTCTVTLQGSTIAGVRYITPPRPGTACWLIWQGGAPLVIGGVADAYGPPAATIQSSNALSVANNTWTAMPNNVAPTLNNDAWAMIAADGQWTAPCDGMYLLTASVQYPSNATGLRALRILSGAAVMAWSQVTPMSGAGTALSVATIAGFGKGATAVAQTIQTSGAALSTGHMQFSVAWQCG